MYISIKRHSCFFKSWWCLLYFGHVPTRTIGKCWHQKTPFCLKLSAHVQWRQKPPFCLKLSTHAQKSVLSWSISMSRILGNPITRLIRTANSHRFAKLECDLYAQFWLSLWRDFAHLKVRSWRCIILLWTEKYHFLPYFLNYLEKKAGTPI